MRAEDNKGGHAFARYGCGHGGHYMRARDALCIPALQKGDKHHATWPYLANTNSSAPLGQNFVLCTALTRLWGLSPNTVPVGALILQRITLRHTRSQSSACRFQPAHENLLWEPRRRVKQSSREHQKIHTFILMGRHVGCDTFG